MIQLVDIYILIITVVIQILVICCCLRVQVLLATSVSFSFLSSLGHGISRGFCSLQSLHATDMVIHFVLKTNFQKMPKQDDFAGTLNNIGHIGYRMSQTTQTKYSSYKYSSTYRKSAN